MKPRPITPEDFDDDSWPTASDAEYEERIEHLSGYEKTPPKPAEQPKEEAVP